MSDLKWDDPRDVAKAMTAVEACLMGYRILPTVMLNQTDLGDIVSAVKSVCEDRDRLLFPQDHGKETP